MYKLVFLKIKRQTLFWLPKRYLKFDKMSAQNWLTYIENAKKSCIVQNKTRKVHYLLPDEREMVEEYNLETEVLTRRSWKVKSNLGADGGWEVEIGDPEPKPLNMEATYIFENSNQPFVSKRLTKRNIEWRIRNLPYPIDVYSVTADQDSKCLIVRTSNKKYYKKLTIPELERVQMFPEQDSIAFTHKYNTLIITYKKPTAVLNLEKAVFLEISKIKPVQGDDNCKPS